MPSGSRLGDGAAEPIHEGVPSYDAASVAELGEMANVEIARTVARYELFKRIALVVPIAGFWVPLQAVLPIARVLAGKHTKLEVTFSISIAISLAISAGALALWRKTRSQGSELQRLRARCERLEEELDEMKGAA
jgi:hypothetical protein